MIAGAHALWVKDGAVALVAERPGKPLTLPGGKLLPGESRDAALARELDEELGFVGTTTGPWAASVAEDGSAVAYTQRVPSLWSVKCPLLWVPLSDVCSPAVAPWVTRVLRDQQLLPDLPAAAPPAASPAPPSVELLELQSLVARLQVRIEALEAANAPRPAAMPATSAATAKGALNEWAQARGAAVSYESARRGGPDNAPVFAAYSRVRGANGVMLAVGEGLGPNKGAAEAAAAAMACEHLRAVSPAVTSAVGGASHANAMSMFGSFNPYGNGQPVSHVVFAAQSGSTTTSVLAASGPSTLSGRCACRLVVQPAETPSGGVYYPAIIMVGSANRSAYLYTGTPGATFFSTEFAVVPLTLGPTGVPAPVVVEFDTDPGANFYSTDIWVTLATGPMIGTTSPVSVAFSWITGGRHSNLAQVTGCTGGPSYPFVPTNIAATGGVTQVGQPVSVNVAQTNSVTLTSTRVPVDVLGVAGVLTTAPLPVNVTQVASVGLPTGSLPVDLDAVGGTTLTSDVLAVSIDEVGGTAVGGSVPVTIAGSAPGVATDVNVVHISQLDVPLWTSNTDPGQPPMLGNFRAEAELQRQANRRRHALNGNTYEEAKNWVSSLAQQPTDDTSFEIPTGALATAVRFLLDGDVPTCVVDDGQVATAKRAPQGPSGSKKRDETRASGSTAVKEEPAATLQQRFRVLDRVVARVKRLGDEELVAYLIGCHDRAFALDVCRGLWGRAWTGWLGWFATWRLLAPSEGAEAALTARGDELYGLLLEAGLLSRPGAAAWLLEHTEQPEEHWAGRHLAVRTRVGAAIDQLDGKLTVGQAGAGAHKGDGPKFNCTMDDVKSSPTYESMLRTPLVQRTPEPWVVALQVATVPSSTNPTDTDIPTQQPFRGDVVLANNTVLPAQQLFPPEGLCVPRQVCVVNSFVDSTNRLAPVYVGVLTFQGDEMVDTALFMSIVESAIKANMNIGRADNTTLGGFNAFDVAYVGRLRAYAGLCLEQCIMKLLATSLIVGFSQPERNLPRAGLTSGWDPRTSGSVTGNLQTSYNDSPVFGEDCGGDAAELPFGPGGGLLAFHLSFETVPENERNMAIMLPANLLLADVGSNLSIFLFVLMWAEFPLVMHTWIIPTLDSVGGGPTNITHVPFLAQMYIPGQRNLHIILPRRQTLRNPRDQAEANVAVLVQPETGSQPSQLFNPGENLLVNYVGGPLTQYDLAQYAYTWMTDVSPTEIAQFLQRLNDVVPIGDTIKVCYEKLAMLGGVRYPPLVALSPTAISLPDTNDATFWRQFTPFGTAPPTTTRDWPQAQKERPDYFVSETNPIAWNKCAVGVAVGMKMGPRGLALPRMIGAPYEAYWFTLLARQQAVAMNVYLGALGLSATTWNTAFVNSDMNSFRKLVQSHYCGLTRGLVPVTPPSVKVIDRMFTALFGCSPTRDMNDNTAFAYNAPPRAGSARSTVLNGTLGNVADSALPIWLPDAWIQQTADVMPRGFGSFPVQNNASSTVGLGGAEGYTTLILGDSTLYGSYYRPSTLYGNVSQLGTRDDTDEEIWNARLFVILAACQFYTLSGAVVPNLPAAGNVVRMQNRRADAWVPTPTIGLRSANTFWMPRTTAGGLKVFPAVARGLAAPISRVLAGLMRAAIEIWSVADVLPSGDYKITADAGESGLWLSLLRENSLAAAAGPAEAAPAAAASSKVVMGGDVGAT